MARVKVTKNVDTTSKFYISAYTANCSIIYQTSAQDNSGNIYLDFVVQFNTSISASVDFTVGTMSDALLEAVKSSVFGNRNDGLYTVDAIILDKPSRLVFLKGSNQNNVIARSDAAISPGAFMLANTIIPALGTAQGG